MINLVSQPSPVSTQRRHTHTQYGETGATEEMKGEKKHGSGWKEKSLKSLHTHADTHSTYGLAQKKQSDWEELSGYLVCLIK